MQVTDDNLELARVLNEKLEHLDNVLVREYEKFVFKVIEMVRDKECDGLDSEFKTATQNSAYALDRIFEFRDMVRRMSDMFEMIKL